MQNQIYGMPVLLYYTNLVPKVLLDMIEGLEKKTNGQFTLERTYQLEIFTKGIREVVLEEHSELECLIQLKPLAEKYQFFLCRLKKNTNVEDKLRAIVGAEDDYCQTISAFREENNLKSYYVFT